MALDFRQSEGAPTSLDIGNKEIQGRVVSKTIQMAMFTTNRNAVWAGYNNLRKSSYPFAQINFLVNRDLFRLQVGDCFKFTYSKYSISEMVCRVFLIQEEGLESENLKITAIEDIFSSSSIGGTVDDPEDHRTLPPDYTVDAIMYQKVIESPYVVSGDVISVIPIAARVSGNELGYLVYMSWMEEILMNF